MAVSFTLTFTDEQAARLAPVVNWLAHEVERHPKIQAFLDGSSIDDLTAREKATLVLKLYLFNKCKMYERELAERAAGAASDADVEANIPLGVD